VFEAATLSDVAESSIAITSASSSSRIQAYGFHISGIFSSTDPDSLIKFLRERPGVKVTEAERGKYGSREVVSAPCLGHANVVSASI